MIDWDEELGQFVTFPEYAPKEKTPIGFDPVGWCPYRFYYTEKARLMLALLG